MRKIFKMAVAMMMLMSISAFAKPLSAKYDKKVAEEKRKVAQNVEELKRGERTGIVLLTGVSNEEFLAQVGRIDQKLNLYEVHFVFPDMRYVDKYIEQVSKNIPYVVIYLLDRKSDEEGLEYRDSPTLYELGMEKKLQNLGNVLVISVMVSEEDTKKIMPNSFGEVALDDEIIKKYIMKRR